MPSGRCVLKARFRAISHDTDTHIKVKSMTTQVQAQDKVVTVNGLQLHYLDWGTSGKTPMVLLHGLRGHAHSWDDFSMAMCQQGAFGDSYTL